MNEMITWWRAQLDTDERTANEALEALHPMLRSSTWHARVLRQVQAHRAILTAYDDALSRKQYYDRDGEEEWFKGHAVGYIEALEGAIKRLVSVCSDWDGYRAEWVSHVVDDTDEGRHPSM